MAAISGKKVAQAAHSAGFRDDTLVTMVAIARAESGWDPRAHNPDPPDNSFGLWQINMIGDLGPERRKALGIDSNDELFDPATNARAAKLIHKQQGFDAWSVFLHGTFKAHLDKARTAVQDANLSPGTPSAEDEPTTLSPEALKAISSSLLNAKIRKADGNLATVRGLLTFTHAHALAAEQEAIKARKLAELAAKRAGVIGADIDKLLKQAEAEAAAMAAHAAITDDTDQ
jgi:hypothetical protein